MSMHLRHVELQGIPPLERVSPSEGGGLAVWDWREVAAGSLRCGGVALWSFGCRRWVPWLRSRRRLGSLGWAGLLDRLRPTHSPRLASGARGFAPGLALGHAEWVYSQCEPSVAMRSEQSYAVVRWL